MSLELVNTFGTLLTVAIIAATAIAAMVQLRHLRASNQITAMLSIGNQFESAEFRNATTLVRRDLDAALEYPAYREYTIAMTRRTRIPAVPKEYDDLFNAASLVGNTFEELGILMKNGIIDRDLFLDRYGWAILQTWNRFQRTVAWARDVSNEPTIWENFEYLTVLAQDFARERGSTYPKGVRHLELRNPWSVPPMPATP